MKEQQSLDMKQKNGISYLRQFTCCIRYHKNFEKNLEILKFHRLGQLCLKTIVMELYQILSTFKHDLFCLTYLIQFMFLCA